LEEINGEMYKRTENGIVFGVIRCVRRIIWEGVAVKKRRWFIGGILEMSTALVPAVGFRLIKGSSRPHWRKRWRVLLIPVDLYGASLVAYRLSRMFTTGHFWSVELISAIALVWHHWSMHIVRGRWV
jgi:hypothetical protein